MGIGIGIVLLVIGLILVTGVLDLSFMDGFVVDPEALGWILILAAIISVGLTFALNRQNNNRTTTHVEERRYDR